VHLREFAGLFLELEDLPVARALDPERRRVAPGYVLDQCCELLEIDSASLARSVPAGKRPEPGR
jgi:hypothetical protein